MKTLMLTTLFSLFSIGLTFSQTKINSSSNSQGQRKSSTNFSAEKLAGGQSTGDSLTDEYMGYKDQILLRLITKEIPQNFPKPKMGQTREEYKEAMFIWFEENLNMVKEEYHANLK